MIFMLFFCRQPGPRECGGFAPINRDTRANSSRSQAGNTAATNNPLRRPDTGGGAQNAGAGQDSSLPISGNLVIGTQPERTPAARLSGGGPGFEPSSPATLPGNTQTRNQSKTTATVAILGTPTVPTLASSTTAFVVPTPLSMPSNSARPAYVQSSSHGVDVPSAITLSSIEIAMIEEYRRRRAASAFVETPASPPPVIQSIISPSAPPS
ncbi:hypothetical protein PAXRUDRAFT_347188 [Paxillus rubicundulus Ve08.2h10]|uniref:Uncharacterized protein n=1 Tax=Paxillus rubicundulus Ve08.2h10 TaxID=930991 RepID=A0A0D0DRX6_9AGAM|nr:hypothetical protein PAXRUDRAFT_347188 [Paxillus rubicundulus Ve08.2h10]